MNTNLCFDSYSVARNNLGIKKVREIIERAVRISTEFRKKETELIEVLTELDQTKAYRMEGYNSLFQFCMNSLSLSDSLACHYIAIARVTAQIPELKQALEENRITASKARRLCSVIDERNAKDWIQTAEKLNHRDLEKAVRAKDPRRLQIDRMSFLTETLVKIEGSISLETREKLLRCIELKRNSNAPLPSYDDLLSSLCDLYLDKNDPLQKARRALKVVQSGNAEIESRTEPISDSPGSARLKTEMRSRRGADSRIERPSKSEGTSGTDRTSRRNETTNTDRASTTKAKPSRSVPARIRHQVKLREQGQCRYHLSGKRCESRVFLELHHRLPFAKGGESTVHNLVTLCSAHHHLIHRQ